jgi:nitric oxide reductase NorQ protein
VREGAVLYLDEVAEAREDVWSCCTRSATTEGAVGRPADEELKAARASMLVVSFNPGYRRGLKELKPSTRQRFVTVRPPPRACSSPQAG